MDQATLEAYRQAGFNRIPVYRELLADLDTPLSIYVKLANGPYSYLFESAAGGETWGRYSIIGLTASAVCRVFGHRIAVDRLDGESREEEVDDPLAWIENFRRSFRVPEVPELPRFAGGLVGYFGYETVRLIEPRLAGRGKSDPLQCPDILLMVSDELVIYDNFRGSLKLVVHAPTEAADGWEKAEARLDELVARLRAPWPAAVLSAVAQDVGAFRSNFGESAYGAAVERARRYIRDGDVMQVVLSQRLSASFGGAPLNVYRSLRRSNPSPYMYYLELGEFQVVGASPEVLVRLEDGNVTLRPIAGTRPRGNTEAADRALEAELLADPKERAEHLMLIDLGRNDVGRISEIGSVRLTAQMAIERYSHVMHIVSEVRGRLRAGLGPMDVLRACFPAGTLSGAPKIRALEIIDELEPSGRGVYSGAVGYIGWHGTMDTAIAIRTAIIKDGSLHVQAGGGIVHDSIPANEWQETLNKGRAVLRAAEMASRGLDDGGKGDR
jgi:anthranilate synthase component 1